MDSQVVALSGTALSAAIAALAFWAKLRHERLRTTRVVLYHLLELRYHLAMAEFGTTRLASAYMPVVDAALKRHGIALLPEQRDAIGPLLTQMVRELAAANVQELATQVVVPYLTALGDLARDDPVLAYSLKGREVLTRASTAITEHARLASMPTTSPEEVQIKDALLADIDDFDRTVTLKLLAHACRQVARHCSPIMYVRTLLVIRKQDSAEVPPSITARIDAMLDRALKRLIEHEVHKLQSQTAPVVAG